MTTTQELQTKPALKSGDWVLYRGRPRQVVAFHPYDYPEMDIPADPRYDMVDLQGLKKSIYVREVQVMKID